MSVTTDERVRVFTGARGVRLHGWTRRSHDAPRGHVLIVHGIGEHSGRYVAFVEPFVAAGWVVHGYDHRGHGRSGGQRGHVTRWADYLDDLAAALHTLAPSDGTPRFLLGHSMGGLITLDFLGTRPGIVDGAIVSAPPLDPWRVAGPVRVAVARVLTHLLPRLPIPVGEPTDVLSRDPEVIRACAQDALCHSRVTPRWGAAILRAIDRVNADAERLPGPVLLLHGDDDLIAAVEGTRRYAERVRDPQVTLRVYPGVRHEPHNDLGADVVVADVMRWLDQAAPLS